MKLYLATRLRHLLAASAAVALVACGGGGGGGSGSASTAVVPTAAVATGSATAATSGNLGLAPPAASMLQLDGRQLPDYTPKLPPHFAGVQAQDNTPAGTVPAPVMATLGRVLFHDKAL